MNIPASDDELLGMLGDLLRRVDPMPSAWRTVLRGPSAAIR